MSARFVGDGKKRDAVASPPRPYAMETEVSPGVVRTGIVVGEGHCHVGASLLLCVAIVHDVDDVGDVGDDDGG